MSLLDHVAGGCPPCADRKSMGLPKIDMGRTEGRFLLHFDGSDQAAKNRKYRVALSDGRVVEGFSDDQGLTSLVGDDLLRIMHIEIGAPETLS